MRIATLEDACALAGIPTRDVVGLTGGGWAELRRDGELVDLVVFANLITDVGDEYYGERAANISSPPNQVTGMKLGTGSTTPSKTGAGAAIVTYVSSITASKAIEATWPQSSQPGGAGTARQIQWRVTWNAGEATQNGLAEAVVSNQTALADTAGTAADTIARALLSPSINKGASDVLTLTWNHNLLGA